MLVRMQKWGTLLRCWWECKLVQPFWKTVWRFFKKLKIQLSYDPAIVLLGIYPKDTNSNLKGHMHPNVYSSIINNSQIMERAQMSISWWMDKEDVVYMYNGWIYTHTHTHKHTNIHTLYLAIKKNEILPFAMTCMKLECIILSEIS